MSNRRLASPRTSLAALTVAGALLITSSRFAPAAERFGDPGGGLTLELSEEGEITYDGKSLFDPEEDGLRALREELAAIVEELEEATEGELELTLRVEAEAEAPFELVQGILDAWRPVDSRSESAVVQLDAEESEACNLPLDELDLDDEDVVRLIVARDPEEEDAEVVYRVGEDEYDEVDAALEALLEVRKSPSVLLATRGPVRVEEVLPALEVLRELGLEQIAIAPWDDEVRERALARWGCIAEADWEGAYDFMTPERREQEDRSRFLENKEDHEYRDPELRGLPDVSLDTAYAQIKVAWTPHHAILIHIPGQDFTQELEMVETWKRIDDTWYWAEVARTHEFFAEHRELEDD